MWPCSSNVSLNFRNSALDLLPVQDVILEFRPNWDIPAWGSSGDAAAPGIARNLSRHIPVEQGAGGGEFQASWLLW